MLCYDLICVCKTLCYKHGWQVRMQCFDSISEWSPENIKWALQKRMQCFDAILETSPHNIKWVLQKDSAWTSNPKDVSSNFHLSHWIVFSGQDLSVILQNRGWTWDLTTRCFHRSFVPHMVEQRTINCFTPRISYEHITVWFFKWILVSSTVTGYYLHLSFYKMNLGICLEFWI